MLMLLSRKNDLTFTMEIDGSQPHFLKVFLLVFFLGNRLVEKSKAFFFFRYVKNNFLPFIYYSTLRRMVILRLPRVFSWPLIRSQVLADDYERVIKINKWKLICYNLKLFVLVYMFASTHMVFSFYQLYLKNKITKFMIWQCNIDLKLDGDQTSD